MCLFLLLSLACKTNRLLIGLRFVYHDNFCNMRTIVKLFCAITINISHISVFKCAYIWKSGEKIYLYNLRDYILTIGNIESIMESKIIKSKISNRIGILNFFFCIIWKPIFCHHGGKYAEMGENELLPTNFGMESFQGC